MVLIKSLYDIIHRIIPYTPIESSTKEITNNTRNNAPLNNNSKMTVTTKIKIAKTARKIPIIVIAFPFL